MQLRPRTIGSLENNTTIDITNVLDDFGVVDQVNAYSEWYRTPKSSQSRVGSEKGRYGDLYREMLKSLRFCLGLPKRNRSQLDWKTSNWTSLSRRKRNEAYD